MDFSRHVLMLTAAFVLAACGEGGDPSVPQDMLNNGPAFNRQPTVNNPSQDPTSDTQSLTYTAGVYEDSSNFKSRCETPRTGIDPFTQSAYADQAGSTAHENFWLRSWSDETYLWYDEIADINPLNFTEPTQYFQVLKTEQVTPSGNPKDKFHFTYDSQEWYDLIQSGESLGYGAMLVQTRSSSPREIRVAYVERNSPAADAGVSRGDRIITADGVSVADASSSADIDTLNAALFPSAADPQHSFTILKNSGQEISANMTARVVSADAVLETAYFSSPTSPDRIGYILFNDHNAIAEQQLYESVNFLQANNVDELILDLRYNGGGYLVVASQLATMIAGSQADDVVFDGNEFNDKLVNRHPQTGEVVEPMPFIDFGVGLSLAERTALPLLNLNRVYILAGEGTCSASEAIINGLRGIDLDVVLIGNTTCGKPYGFYAEDNCGTTYFTIQVKGSNNKGFGDYSDGFSPSNGAVNIGEPVNGCFVADDFEDELGDVNEARLATALYYYENQTCPPLGSFGSSKLSYSAEEKVLRPAVKEISIH